MCTVTFLPLAGKGYILTSNRDEEVARPARFPEFKEVYAQSVLFPQDPKAGGTWVATSKNNFTLCLLNGAFEKHVPQGPYRLSRGIMLLGFFKYNDVNAFIEQYDFTGIEQFTLLVVDSNDDNLALHELRWDTKQLYHAVKDTGGAHIWSSATLYDKETIEKRETWFHEWLQNHHDYKMEDIISFHTFGGNKDTDSLVMSRGNVLKTLSITSIQKDSSTYSLSYTDLLKKEITNYNI